MFAIHLRNPMILREGKEMSQKEWGRGRGFRAASASRRTISVCRISRRLPGLAGVFRVTVDELLGWPLRGGVYTRSER